MKKDEILNASRKEHRNKDLAEMEVVYQAGSHASRVGALVCCLLSLLSSVLAHTMIYSPWVIYFSIIATQWLVRFIKMKRSLKVQASRSQPTKRRRRKPGFTP